MRLIAGCEKLWHVRGGGAHDEGYESVCKEDMDETEVRNRMAEYDMKLDGNDMMMVMECDDCGPMMTEYLLKDCEECGPAWVRENYTLTVLGNDVIALFPSLDSVNT